MHDFDSTRFDGISEDRRFKIGGEEFTFHAKLPADLVAAYVDATGKSLVELVESADALVAAVIGPEQEEKWRRVRSVHSVHPLSVDDLQGVVRYLGEATRPEDGENSSDSSGSSAPTGTSSTAKPPLAAVNN